jgi:RES domain-containing protein
MKAWRITKQRHARSAFSGEGARLYGGRWISPGVQVVYVAESQSLDVLEVLVHLDTPALLERYVFLEVDFDASLVIDLDRSSLPKNWQSDPVPEATQAIGDRWVLSGDAAVLRMPSALVPGNRISFSIRAIRISEKLASRGHTHSASILVSHGDSNHVNIY